MLPEPKEKKENEQEKKPSSPKRNPYRTGEDIDMLHERDYEPSSAYKDDIDGA